MKIIDEIQSLLEFSDLENEVLDLADMLVDKYPKSKKKVDKVMRSDIDVENIRQESDASLKSALKKLKKIEKEFS